MTHTLHDHAHDHAHGHGHGHDHGHDGRWARLRHGVSDVFGAHSHDAADQVDEALEADVRGRRALWISLCVLALTATLQGVVVAVTGSVALLGDTLHNVADALTAVPLLVAFWLARRPADDRFTYGYGRAEDLAGLFVVAMIALSSILAGWEAIDRLFHPREVEHVWAVAAAGVVGFCGNELVARYRIRVGRQIGSAALVADGLHARTDGFTSLAVVLGAAGVAVGLPWADPVIGLLIAIAILGVLRSALKQVGARLMDAVTPEDVRRAREAVGAVDGVLEVRSLRLRWIGHTLHADGDITVSAELPVSAGHDIAHHAEEHLLEALPRLTSVVLHVSPDGAHA
ncbi:cation diffusion facilitator family transporter [Nocardioides sp. YR527]|uniref:cation diffusion facilitator family transporter n=1 Tax=Nocardioides sp. YR527 TaxID=1881028 RepID=UPI000889B1C2|nr:cation diffusion facilitator family transporter [Nocardioides sp. YR527]SDJ89168.1 cation diffusion facilitator family transporter [Nocardioides sp. YR527]